MDRTLEDLIESAGTAEREAAADWGGFTLFGLFEDAENPGYWDLVAAAPWIEAKRRAEAISILAVYVTRNLDPRSAILIGRIVPVGTQSEFVLDVTRRFPTRGRVREVEAGVYGDVEIRRGYVLTAGPVPHREAAAA